MKNKKLLKILCVIQVLLICIIMIWGHVNRKHAVREVYSDGIEQIALDNIYLEKSGVQVEFSDVLLSNHEETRKLIVSTQQATVYTELTARLVKSLDFEFMKKTQRVYYTGTGYFVVDLDNLSRDNIIQDKEKKTLTIQIDHAYLQAIEIDPNKVVIGDVRESLLARGDIELTLKDYNSIEKELRDNLEEKFDTVNNGQEADALALKMVKEVYEPIVKAIDPSYDLLVEFR